MLIKIFVCNLKNNKIEWNFNTSRNYLCINLYKYSHPDILLKLSFKIFFLTFFLDSGLLKFQGDKWLDSIKWPDWWVGTDQSFTSVLKNTYKRFKKVVSVSIHLTDDGILCFSIQYFICLIILFSPTFQVFLLFREQFDNKGLHSGFSFLFH